MPKIIVVDGSSNAGKTTLCNMYSEKLENVYIVPGASKFVKERSEEYPNGVPKIPKTKEEEIENQKFFFDLEFKRLKLANEMMRKGKNVIMDRNFLEILAVAYSLEKEEKYNGIYDNACKLYDLYQKEAKKQGLRLPDKYIILFAEQTTLEARNQTRNNILSSEWMNKSLIDNQKEFFSKFFEKYKDQAISVDTTEKSALEVFNEIEGILDLGKVEIKDDRSTYSH